MLFRSGPVPPTRILYSTLFYPRVLSRCCPVIENLPLLIRRSKSMMRLCFPVRLIIFKTIVCWCFLLVIQFSFSKTWIRNWQSFAAKFGSFLQTNFAFIYEQCVWCAEGLFNLITNQSLFAVMRWKCFYFDRRSKFICRDTLKIFLLWLWIEVYLQWSRCEKYFYFVFDHQSKFIYHVLKMFLLWSSIEVYLPWYTGTVFTLIINRSLVLQILIKTQILYYLNY